MLISFSLRLHKASASVHHYKFPQVILLWQFAFLQRRNLKNPHFSKNLETPASLNAIRTAITFLPSKRSTDKAIVFTAHRRWSCKRPSRTLNGKQVAGIMESDTKLLGLNAVNIANASGVGGTADYGGNHCALFSPRWYYRGNEMRKQSPAIIRESAPLNCFLFARMSYCLFELFTALLMGIIYRVSLLCRDRGCEQFRSFENTEIYAGR